MVLCHMKRLVLLLPAAFIAIYFFHQAGLGLRAGFTQDDLMNMYRSLVRPYPDLLLDNLMFWRFSPTFRPFGGLVYKFSLDLFGVDLRALSILRYAALCVNVLLLYALARRLAGSREAGVLAALLHSYHLAFSSLYYNSGTLYDVFCFTFFFAAFLYYVRIRQSGQYPGAFQVLVICLLLILGLDSKEMAVVLPVLLGFYELLYHPPKSFAPKALAVWAGRASVTPLIGAGIVLAFCAGRLAHKEGLANLGGYQPVVSLAEYLKQTGHYLAEAIYKPDPALPPEITALFLLLLFGLALIMRSRVLAMSALLFVVGILPLAFIPWRSLSAAYIPVAGLAICCAVVLVALRDVIERSVLRLPEPDDGILWGVTPGRIVLFTLLATLMLRVHPDSSSHYDSWRREYTQIGGLMEQMHELHPTLKKGGRILMVKDPFPYKDYRWASLFAAGLVYHDKSLVVERVEQFEPAPYAAQVAGYDLLLTYENGRLRDALPTEVPVHP